MDASGRRFPKNRIEIIDRRFPRNYGHRICSYFEGLSSPSTERNHHLSGCPTIRGHLCRCTSKGYGSIELRYKLVKAPTFSLPGLRQFRVGAHGFEGPCYQTRHGHHLCPACARFSILLTAALLDALHDKHATLHSSLPDRPYCSVSWRIVPGVCPIQAVECDDYNSRRWRVAVKTFGFAGANDKMIVPLKMSQCVADLCSVSSYRRGVGDRVSLGNNINRRSINLLALTCIISGDADQETS
jgi:hypothetical protein